MPEWYEKKVGPLPLGIWAIGVGGGIGLYVLLTRRQQQTAQEVSVDPASVIAVTRTSPGYIPTPVPQPVDNPPPSTTPGGGLAPAPQPLPISHPISGSPISLSPSPPPAAQPPAPQPGIKMPYYPGLPPGTDISTFHNHTVFPGTFETVVARTKSEHPGYNNTFVMRNIAAVGAYGTGSPWLGRGDWADPAGINRRRIAYGLYPLTDTQINEMITDINHYNDLAVSQGSKEGPNIYAKAIFDKWNYPYQISSHNIPRRDNTQVR